VNVNKGIKGLANGRDSACGPCMPLGESLTASPLPKLHLISTQWRSKETTNRTPAFVA